MHFPVKARDRLAVTSYPFRAYIESPTNRGRKASVPGMEITEFPAFVIEKFGVYNINPLIDHFRSTDSTYLESFRGTVAKAGSHVVDLGLPGKQFYASDPDVRKSAVDSGRKWIDMAVLVGSPSVRQHVSGKHGEKPEVDLAAGSLGQLAEYGAKRNIVVNLENDNAVAEDPFFLVNVIEKVNNPYLRALPDFGNSLSAHDAEFNAKAVAAMLKHAFNMCHVKDTVESHTGQTQTVDLQKMFELAKTSSYPGFFSMEFDTNAGDPIPGTQKLVNESLKYLK
jgi:sugar phosphate isomerase/epimerase